jgi:hypothetical protein
MEFVDGKVLAFIGAIKMQPNQYRFLTERLPLAIYLHASGRLIFSHCEDAGRNKLQFVFLDPSNMGDQFELEFENGAVCVANSLFASQKFLRRKMSEAQNYNEKRKNTYAYDSRS